MTQDANVLEGIVKEVQGQLSSLREEYQLATKDLEEETALIKEIESSDQDYLNELQATIAEQAYV